MVLDLEIQDWTAEHDRNIKMLLWSTWQTYNSLQPTNRGQEVVVVGNNWFYTALASNVGSRPTKRSRGEKWSEIMITPGATFTMPGYVPLERILTDFKDNLKDEFTLFPIGERRETESGMLGTRKQTREYGYDTTTSHGKKVKVVQSR